MSINLPPFLPPIIPLSRPIPLDLLRYTCSLPQLRTGRFLAIIIYYILALLLYFS